MIDHVLHNDIKAARARRGYSQSELAERCDVTRQTIAAIEKGDYSPSVMLALRLSLALNTPINELFWLKDK
jgi:putative transcriptional regulator